MHGVEGELIAYIQQNKESRGKPNCQTKHIDKCISALAHDIAKSEEEVVENHK
jgi:hypothetical protein